MRNFLRGNRGSFTLEATVAVPVFLIFLVLLINLIKLTMVYVAMDHAVSETAKMIAACSFPLQDLTKKESGGELNAISGLGSEILDEALREVVRKGKGIVLDAALREIIERKIIEYYPLKRLSNNDFELSEVKLFNTKSTGESKVNTVALNSEDMAIVVVYKVKIPMPFIPLREITLSNTAVERAWSDG